MKIVFFAVVVAMLVVAIQCRHRENEERENHRMSERFRGDERHHHEDRRPFDNHHPIDNRRPTNSHRQQQSIPKKITEPKVTKLITTTHATIKAQKSTVKTPIATKAKDLTNPKAIGGKHRVFRSAKVETSTFSAASNKSSQVKSEKPINFVKIFKSNRSSIAKPIFTVKGTVTVVDCRFNWRNMTINCQNMVNRSSVECNVTSALKAEIGDYWTKYNGFAISSLSSKANVVPHFHLYPHSIMEQTFVNSTNMPNSHFVLYQKPSASNTYKFIGYQFVDGKCWDRFVNMFSAVSTFDLIKVKNVAEKVKAFGYMHF